MSAFSAYAARFLGNLVSDAWSVLHGRGSKRADRRASYRPAVDTLENRLVPTTAVTHFAEVGAVSRTASASITLKQGLIDVSAGYADTVAKAPLVLLPGTSDWFQFDFQDGEIRTLAETDFQRDKAITRNDLLGIFSQAESDGAVSASEFLDLKFMIANASVLKMPEYVFYLGDKVVNGDPANDAFQSLGTFDGGKADVEVSVLGNLYAGSSAVQLTQLVNKWFYGMDLPTTAITDPSSGSTTSYRYAYDSVGTLFGSGAGSVSELDIHQGYVGDCWLLAAAADVAKQEPGTIRKMFIDDGDGSFTVHLFDAAGKSSYVTVNRWLPETSSGKFIFAGQGQSLSSPAAKLWVPLLEKAVAQLNHSGRLDDSRDVSNSYQGLASGYGGYGMIYLTGLTQSSLNNALNQASFNAAVSAGKLVTLLSKGSDTDPVRTIDLWDVVPNHEYALLNYKPSTGIYTLFNPWGTLNSNANVEIGVTWSQLTDIFLSYDTGANPLTPAAVKNTKTKSSIAVVLAGAKPTAGSPAMALGAPDRSELVSFPAVHSECTAAWLHVPTNVNRSEPFFDYAALLSARETIPTILASIFDHFWNEIGSSHDVMQPFRDHAPCANGHG